MDQAQKIFAWELVFQSGYCSTLNFTMCVGHEGNVMKKLSKPMMRALLRDLFRQLEEHRNKHPEQFHPEGFLLFVPRRFRQR